MLRVAAPTDVDSDNPRPSSSLNPAATLESNPDRSPNTPPTTPPTEPGVSPNSMSPTVIVEPPVANVNF